MPNRRLAPRSNTIYHTRVLDQLTGSTLGHLVDISEYGIRVTSDTPLVKGDEFSIRLELPTDLCCGGAITLKARVKWCRPDVNPDLWAIGFQITEQSEDFAAVYATLRNHYCFDG